MQQDVTRCIGCGCTSAAACPGGCSWVSLKPPKCSACFDPDDALHRSDDGTPLAIGDAGEPLFGIEWCPASETPAAHVPLYTSELACHCARCKLDLAA